MSTTEGIIPQQLHLHQKHVGLHAKLGHFGSFEVPLYYTSILEEHEAVRLRAGLFDISHMGKFYFEGAGAESFLNKNLPRNISAMKYGQALYMPLLSNQGVFVDDIIVYRIELNRFYIIVNAGNIEKDRLWFKSRLTDGVIFRDLSPEYGLLALQGPKAEKILSKIYPNEDWTKLPYYYFKILDDAMIARTGYTGEDGFELMVPLSRLAPLWDALLSLGHEDGVVPIGFGARDTLRLEAGMPLYGHDINEDVSPVEAGLLWAVDFSKENFPGSECLRKQKQDGPRKRLVGLEVLDRGIPRQDYIIVNNGTEVGKVTSGSFSPTLKKNIAMGYVPVELALLGAEVGILIRDKVNRAKIVKLPFYKRSK